MWCHQQGPDFVLRLLVSKCPSELPRPSQSNKANHQIDSWGCQFVLDSLTGMILLIHTNTNTQKYQSMRQAGPSFGLSFCSQPLRLWSTQGQSEWHWIWAGAPQRWERGKAGSIPWNTMEIYQGRVQLHLVANVWQPFSKVMSLCCKNQKAAIQMPSLKRAIP